MQREIAGFTLLEAIIVIAVLIGAAGVVLPLMSAEMHDTKITRALDDASRIAGAYNNAARDRGMLPGADAEGTPTATYYTSGALPGGLPLGKREQLIHLFDNTPESAPSEKWKGPYLGEVGSDPWGRAYVVLVPSKNAVLSKKEGTHVWALSAGRDGIVSTTERDDAVAGDDIGVCVR
ncbi:MAG: type II secretion system protein GspG [Planctomycetota bacterium]